MKTGRLFLISVLVVMALALTGCFNVTQEMTISPDLSGKMTLDMGVSDALMQMASSGGSTTTNPFGDLGTQFKGNTQVSNLQVKDYKNKEGGQDMQHFAVSFDVKNFKEFIKTDQGSQGFTMSLEQLANGNYKFTQKISTEGSGAGLPAGTDVKQFESYLKDMYWSVKLNVPTVVAVSANATNKSNNYVEWKIPIMDMLSGKAIELSAEFNMTPSAGGGGGTSPLLFIIIGAIVLLVIVIVVILLANRKPKQPPYPPYPPQNYQNYPPAQQ